MHHIGVFKHMQDFFFNFLLILVILYKQFEINKRAHENR